MFFITKFDDVRENSGGDYLKGLTLLERKKITKKLSKNVKTLENSLVSTSQMHTAIRQEEGRGRR